MLIINSLYKYINPGICPIIISNCVCVCVCATWSGLDTEISDLDGKPYTTLLYGNGPGYAHTTPTGRHDLTGFNTEDINFVQQAAVPRK